jgi:hypothetical protein
LSRRHKQKKIQKDENESEPNDNETSKKRVLQKKAQLIDDENEPKLGEKEKLERRILQRRAQWMKMKFLIGNYSRSRLRMEMPGFAGMTRATRSYSLRNGKQI